MTDLWIIALLALWLALLTLWLALLTRAVFLLDDRISRLEWGGDGSIPGGE